MNIYPLFFLDPGNKGKVLDVLDAHAFAVAAYDEIETVTMTRDGFLSMVNSLMSYFEEIQKSDVLCSHRQSMS